MVSICPAVFVSIFRKKWLKDSQVAVVMSPGLCLTPMTAAFNKEVLKIANSAESGALKIYETILMQNLDP